MEIISFNTNRMYSKDGQRIVALKDGDTIHFTDIDRNISKTFIQEDFILTKGNIMQKYDIGGLNDSSDHPRILEELKKLGWKSDWYGENKFNQWIR